MRGITPIEHVACDSHLQKFAARLLKKSNLIDVSGPAKEGL